MDNITQQHLFEANEVVDFFAGKLWLSILFAVILLACQIVTSLLYPAIIIYETKGNDPLKRTVLNQIVSLLACYVLYGNILVLPVWQYRLIFGPISPEIGMLFMFFPKSVVTMSSLLAGLEYILIRYLTICIWKGPAPIDELFFGRSVALNNLVVTAFLAFVQNYGKLADPELNMVLTGMEHKSDLPTFKAFGVLALVVAISFVYAEWKIRKFKKKTMQILNGYPKVRRFNNEAQNKPIKISIGWRIFILHHMVLAVKQIVNQKQDDIFEVFFHFVIPVAEVSILLPILVCYENPEILRFFREEFL